MIGQYVNTGRGRRVTISPAVPGAQYRITAWALGDGRSASPAVVDATTGEAGWSYYSYLCRAGGTGPAAPVLAGPIFQAPAIFFKLKPRKEYLQKRRDLASYRSSHASSLVPRQGSKTPF